MLKHSVLGGCAVVLLAAMGCSAPVPELQERRLTSATIIGGKADSGDPAVVALVSIKGKEQSLCTGEVIAPTLVLTASHCINNSPEKVAVIFTPDTSTATDKDIIWAKTATMHPGYNPNTGANDIAVIELSSPTNVTPLSFNRSSIEKHEGETARAIGYGTTKDGDSKTAGKKNEAALKLSKITPTSFLAESLPATQCHGDSGGPVLLSIDGKETIIGVGWRTVRDDGLCAEGVLDTRVDPHVAWIDTFLLAAGGGGGAPQMPPGGGAPQLPPDDGPGGDGAGGAGGTQITCCVNGDKFDCPTSAACLGGFDLDACMDACTDTNCIIACANKGHGAPTNECKKIGTCN